MLKTKTLRKFINEYLDEIGNEFSPKLLFELYTETGKVRQSNFMGTIQGLFKKTTAAIPSTIGINEANLNYSLDLIVPTPKGTNEQVLMVTEILDKLSAKINGSFYELDNGRAKIVSNGGISQGFVQNGSGVGEYLTLSVSFEVLWTPNVELNTDSIKENEVKIKLIKRTPYYNRTIDFNEKDEVVFEFNSSIIGWYHDEVNAKLKIKLPSVFNAQYNYIEVKEFNNNITRWFIIKKEFDEPNIWTHTLKRDLIREYWKEISTADCMIERGYLESSNPLYYKSENINGNLTLGKRSKLLDSNLILAYVKTFNIQNNQGAAIPEGIWKVQAGIPGYSGATIVSEEIPQSIRFYDKLSDGRYNAYLKMQCYSGQIVLIGGVSYYTGFIDSNGNGKASTETSYAFTDNGKPCFTTLTGYNPTESAAQKVKNSVPGYVQYVNYKQGLGIQDIPLWIKNTGGFGTANIDNFPTNFECVINKGTADNPQYYKLVFTDKILDCEYSCHPSNEFISYTGQDWKTTSTSSSGSRFDDEVQGKFSYHEYKIEQFFLSNTKPDAEHACHTSFPATATQTTSGAYSYNIYAFKVYDNGIGINENYQPQSDSGQMIVSALMGTGLGVGLDSNGEENSIEIPSLAGQVIDIQMCPFNETSIINRIEEVIDIYAGSSSNIKVGEYYLLNSQDIEYFVNYDLLDWKKHGNEKSRVNLSQMRLVCPNNSSMSTLNPDIMSNGNSMQFRINGTLYPYKPVYKVTPIATKNLIYSSQDARDNMLVLGGDFSATQVSNGWSDYLIGNKNVEEAQQASIANQTMNQQLQFDYQSKSIATQGSMQMNSAMLGLIGGIAGLSLKDSLMGILGLIGGGMGIMNTQTNMKLQNEGLQVSQNVFNNNIALNQKLFNLQMGNIKAMPNTIHKITNGSYDNDYSVMIEEYYSTKTEYEQFDKTIQRTGMSIDCIGKITDYLNSDYFIYSQMFKCEGINSFYVFDEINKELQNGLKIIEIEN